VHDLMILPQTETSKGSDDDAILLDAALITARVPVLLLPDGMAAKAAAPRNVVVAWNDSNEGAAAVRAALPLLKGAAVSVAIIDPEPHDQAVAEPGSGICVMLARHGLKAQVAVMARTLPRIGDVLTRHVMDQSADLLVMGAWGHSRLRESLFGGATREMIDLCPVPILMAH
jgi:nucleotide-binding universal stress UspA family protein